MQSQSHKIFITIPVERQNPNDIPQDEIFYLTDHLGQLVLVYGQEIVRESLEEIIEYIKKFKPECKID